MIQVDNLTQFSVESQEGKLLLAAIAILSSIKCADIKNRTYGSNVHPNDILKEICNVTNKLYYEKEYDAYIKSEKRNTLVENILLKKP